MDENSQILDLLFEKINLAQFVVILANGTFPSSEFSKKCFNMASKLICCDGAAQKALQNEREPDYIIGDCDSISSDVLCRYNDRIIRVNEQNTNDLTKAFRFCLEQKWQKIILLGTTGEREDHTLGNISLLIDFAKEAEKVIIVTDRGVFYPAIKSGTFNTQKGKQISIFSFDPNQEVTSFNLKYPLNKLRLTCWHTATLNEALSDSFSLHFDASSPLLLYSPFNKEEI